MSILCILLGCYFTAVLGVAGIAKLDSPAFFASRLSSRYKLPQRSSLWISRIFPWGEVIVALLLLTPVNTYRMFITLTVSALFLAFAILHIILHYGYQIDDCSCYGKSLRKRGVTTNITSSIIQWLLSMILLLTTIEYKSVAPFYYSISLAFFIGLFSWLLWRTWQRYHYRFQTFSH